MSNNKKPSLKFILIVDHGTLEILDIKLPIKICMAYD